MLQKTAAILVFAAAAWAAASAQGSGGKSLHDSYGTRLCSWDDFVEIFSTSYFDDGESPQLSEERMDALRNIYDNKINVNTATREELLALPFLSEQQAGNIVDYARRHGPLLSPGELALIPQIDFQTRFLLTAFLSCEAPPRGNDGKGIARLLRGKHTIAANYSTPLYRAEGYKTGSQLKDSQKYLGDKSRTAAKYAYNCNGELLCGLTAEKDAGEPFACRGNSLMDSYSFYALRKQRNGKYSLAVGDFRIHLGEGLTVGNLFFSGKKGVLSNYYRSRNAISPHTSYSERDFFRGAAGSVRVGRLTATAFASYKANDAILTDSGGVSSINSSGYHRTQAEMRRRGNLRDLTAGADISYGTTIISAGLSATATRYSKPLAPRRAEYNRYAMRGKSFHAAALHYALRLRNFSSRGEGAVSETNALALINTIRWRVSNRLSLVSVQRSYSMKYSQPYAESFRSSGHTGNEQGIYVGFAARPARAVTLNGYADFFHCPQPSYRYRAPIDGHELYAEAKLQRKSWYVSADWKLTKRKSDNSQFTDDTISISRQLARLRCGITLRKYSSVSFLSLTTAKNGSATNHGWAIGHRATLAAKNIKATASANYFDARKYAARIFTYENSVRYFYNNFVPLYGKGIRAAATGSIKLWRTVEIYAKYGITHYFDRRSTGSGAATVNSRTQSSMALCMIATI